MESLDLKTAENKMKLLEERILNLEAFNSTNINNDNIQPILHEYQLQMLSKLKSIHEQLLLEGDISIIKKERDDVIQENIILKKDIEKLNYRINHLIKALTIEEEKNMK